jgi:hypothetical protein
MGSCASLSSTAVSASAAAAQSAHALTAKVVGLDGSMAQFAAPVTAHEALAATAAAGGAATTASSSSPPRCFLCCSDDLDFDAPVRALGARDALRPGQLYFALPASTLGRPLSAQDMAALAVKASAALGTAPVVVVVASGNNNQQRRRHSAGRRVAPLVVVSAQEDNGGGEWKSDDAREAAVSGDRTVGKARRGVVGHKGVVVRRLAAAQRLSAIAEAAVE